MFNVRNWDLLFCLNIISFCKCFRLHQRFECGGEGRRITLFMHEDTDLLILEIKKKKIPANTVQAVWWKFPSMSAGWGLAERRFCFPSCDKTSRGKPYSSRERFCHLESKFISRSNWSLGRRMLLFSLAWPFKKRVYLFLWAVVLHCIGIRWVFFPTKMW